jgi:hypothetical protein
MQMNRRENSLMRHGQMNYSRGPSTPARSPGSFAVGQDDKGFMMSNLRQRTALSALEKNMSRNMARYPMVLKDYGFPSYFVRRFRYNEQALVYSELLACSSAFASENAAFRLKDRTQ